MCGHIQTFVSLRHVECDFLFPVTDEQFVLKRIADSAIDIYAMVVVLSRCINTSHSHLPHVFIPHMMYVNIYIFLLCAELPAH